MHLAVVKYAVTTASDWPHVYCTLGVFILYITTFYQVCYSAMILYLLALLSP